jgi:hypothetical protein
VPLKKSPQKALLEPQAGCSHVARNDVSSGDCEKSVQPLVKELVFLFFRCRWVVRRALSGMESDFKAISSSSCRSSISVTLRHKDNLFAFTVVNIYGPYAERPPFSEELFGAGVFNNPMIVIGGDLNFTLSLREVWGPCPREDRQRGFFQDFMESHRLVDVEPAKLAPTWRNLRFGREEVAKRLDRFLILEDLLGMGFGFKSVVEEGGCSDHRPISLIWKFRSEAPFAPLKINQVWFEEVNFKKLVEENWVKLSPSNQESMMV